jgi:hypothetical protein
MKNSKFIIAIVCGAVCSLTAQAAPPSSPEGWKPVSSVRVEHPFAVGDLEIWKDTSDFTGPFPYSSGPFYRLAVNCNTGLPVDAKNLDGTFISYLQLKEIDSPGFRASQKLVYREPLARAIHKDEHVDFNDKTIVVTSGIVEIYPTKNTVGFLPLLGPNCTKNRELIGKKLSLYLKTISRTKLNKRFLLI